MIWKRSYVDNIYSMYSIVQYSTIFYHILQYFTVFYSILQYFTVFYSILQYSTVFHSILQYFTVIYSILQYFTVFYSILQYSTVFHSILQYFTVFYSISQYSTIIYYLKKTCQSFLTWSHTIFEIVIFTLQPMNSVSMVTKLMMWPGWEAVLIVRGGVLVGHGIGQNVPCAVGDLT